MLNRIVTGDESWVHHCQPESKHTSVQWKHPISPSTEKFKVTSSAAKVMFTVFWNAQGVLLAHFQKHGDNVNSESCCEVLLKLRDAIRRKCPGQLARSVLLHHDNARPHTAWATQERIQELQWQLLKHLPYGPDLAPSDFHLFCPLKNHLGGKSFAYDEEVETEVRKWLRQQSKEFYAAVFDALVKCWDKCISVGGGYAEKWMLFPDSNITCFTFYIHYLWPIYWPPHSCHSNLSVY
jgi:histone-lysine N-methyltransferase SETMAR